MMRVGVLLVACCAWLSASSTASWEMNTFADFARGRFSGLSLSRDGRVTLAPRTDTLFASEQPALWSVAQASDGTLYAGTGHKGRLYRVQPSGKAELIWTAPQPEIFAVAAGPDGAVYAGTSPDGKVYRLQGNKAVEYFDPKARYIWALAFGPDGALYAGTGDEGKVFRITKANAGELWYETGQSHITALAVDPQGQVLAGSEPNGILYRISAKGRAFVIYDANLPEIRSITVAPDGAVYAAALGGSVAQKAAAAAAAGLAGGAGAPVTAPTTTITVTDEASTQGGAELKPRPAESPRVTANITPGTVVYQAPQGEMTGVEKSAVFRINTDNTVETVWTSKEENVYDVLLKGTDVVFATDANGRVYQIGQDRRVTLLVQTNEGETTRLIPAGTAMIAATGTAGKLLRFGADLAPQGFYESPVHDAGSVSRWGQIAWRGQQLPGSKLVFRTRAGNSARPDRTWSEWSGPLASHTGSSMSSPNARYVQWRAEFAAANNQSPSLTGVTLSYLPQNNPPAVRSINVTTQIAPATGKAAVQPSTAAYSVTVTDTGDAGASSQSGTPTQNVSRGLSQQIQLVWQADDPDGDRLIYAVYFRGEEESQWKLLRTNFAENMLTLEGDVLADGKYLFRVVASDRQANPASAAREADLISTPVLFDNTPPMVRATAVRQGSRIDITIDASDATSALRRAEYSLDAAAWVPLDSSDGVVDGMTERFTVSLESVAAGERLVVIRVFDASNNAGLAKAVVQ